jgi:hypothetical protein
MELFPTSRQFVRMARQFANAQIFEGRVSPTGFLEQGAEADARDEEG